MDLVQKLVPCSGRLYLDLNAVTELTVHFLGRLYLDLNAVTELLDGEDRLIPKLKKNARALKIKYPFWPSFFKKVSDVKNAWFFFLENTWFYF